MGVFGVGVEGWENDEALLAVDMGEDMTEDTGDAGRTISCESLEGARGEARPRPPRPRRLERPGSLIGVGGFGCELTMIDDGIVMEPEASADF